MAQVAGQVALSYALGLLASKLLGQKKPPLDTDTGTATSQRGSYLPILLGRRRVQPIIAWVGAGYIKKEHAGKGKGAPAAAEARIWHELGFHLLCVGPAARLYRVRQNGKPIFVGPVDPVSTPSGATISAGKEGSLRIFWGEADGPINGPPDFPLADSLADAARLGIASRWPLHAYAYWTDKRLGESRVWPQLDYELEARPQGSFLARTPSWIEATRTPSGVQHAVLAVTNGLPGTAALEVQGNHAAEYPPGTIVRLLGNGAVGDFTVAHSSYVYSTGKPPTVVVVDRTTIVLATFLAGATATGFVERYTVSEDDGCNPAHALAQLLWAPHPYGRGLRQDDWNVDSLEYLGEVCAAERLALNYLSQGGTSGQTVLAAVAAILQDVGCVVGLDAGKLRFKEQRAVDPSGVPLLVPDLSVRPLPQPKTSHDDARPTRYYYTFRDRARNFRELSLAISDHGRASLTRSVRGQKVEIQTATDLATASRVAERRSQEDGAGAGVARVTGSRAARRIFPGQAVRVSGLPGVHRATSVQLDSNSGRVGLELLRDHYGQPLTTYSPPDGGGGKSDPPTEVLPDLGAVLLEVPEYLTGQGTQQVVVPRIRGSAQVAGADLWLSGDGVSYVHVGQDFGVCTGGALVDAVAAEDSPLLEQGPRVAALGPDFGTVMDLSLDHLNWALGRQVAVIVSGGEAEILYLRSVTAVGDYWRLDGLLRARLDTRRLAHPVGSYVYIFRSDQLLALEDPLLAPQVQVFAKAQPFATESYPLELVVPAQQLLYGKGVRPMPCSALRTANLSNSFRTSQSVDLAWQYRSSLVPGSGAGMQGAGQATGASPPDGSFTLRFLTTSAVLKREVSALDVPSYSYSNAQLVADFGSEPSALVVQVLSVRGGYASDALEITVDRV